MPQPRFRKLPPDKQARILDVAMEDFAEYGFEGASYNRIIERAGLSKGAMYYYFDDKTDLYGTVVGRALQPLIAELAPSSADTVEGFWEGLTQDYLRFASLTIEHPKTVALMRGLLERPDRWQHGPLREVFDFMLGYTGQLIDHGQRIGAVRTDLERSLLIAVAFSVGEAVDRWSFEHLDALVIEESQALAQQLIGLFRRVLEPGGEAAR